MAPHDPAPESGQFDERKIDAIWSVLNTAWKKRTLPGPRAFPGLPDADGKHPIMRVRPSLLDDETGLGIHLRWCLALEALSGMHLRADGQPGADAREEVMQACALPPSFCQLDVPAGPDAAAEAWRLHHKISDPFFLDILCRHLNAVYGTAYRKVSHRHALTSALFQTPYFGAHATKEFKHLLMTGEVSRYSRSNRALMEGNPRYYRSSKLTQTSPKLGFFAVGFLLRRS